MASPSSPFQSQCRISTSPFVYVPASRSHPHGWSVGATSFVASTSLSPKDPPHGGSSSWRCVAQFVVTLAISRIKILPKPVVETKKLASVLFFPPPPVLNLSSVVDSFIGKRIPIVAVHFQEVSRVSASVRTTVAIVSGIAPLAPLIVG
eukprot:228664-Rhodomonas_salina.4